MCRPIKKGATDQSLVIRIVDSTDGTPETAVEHNTAGIDLWYRREGAVKTSITEAALTALNDAHADGGIEHIGDGYYRLDLPDAAFATGANGVMVGGAVTGMVVIGCYVSLVDFDPQDAVRLGLTALPNANAEAAGGLFTRGAGTGQINQSNAGQVDVDTRRVGGTAQTARDLGGQLDAAVSTRASQTSLDTVDDFLDTEIAAIKTKTDQLTFTGANKVDAAIVAAGDFAQGAADKVWGTAARTLTSLAGLVPANFASLSITAGGLVDITQAAADKVWGTVARTLTSLVAIAADIRGAVGLAAANLDTQLDGLPTAAEVREELLTRALGGYTSGDTVGDGLRRLNTGAKGMVPITVAAGSTTTVIETNLTEATDDHYNGGTLVFLTGALAGQRVSITDYVGATKRLTVTAATEAPANTDLAVIV